MLLSIQDDKTVSTGAHIEGQVRRVGKNDDLDGPNLIVALIGWKTSAIFLEPSFCEDQVV